MASREEFRKLLKRYNYQVDRIALDQQVAIMWAQLTPEQRVEVQREDYRARIWAAGYEAGETSDRLRMERVLSHVANYMELFEVERIPEPRVDSLEYIAALVLDALGVRNGEQP